ncbi:MAG: 23S rRNA (pseudouridine(1915)-N(3))-methyltransferase RlmH [Clostridia bacterium]
MNIKIITIGKIKEVSLKSLINEYLKRLTKYCKVEILELDDEKIPLNASVAQEFQIKEKESIKIENKLKKIGKCFVFCLDLKGKNYSSEEFSNKIQSITTYSDSTLVFVIGGSLGLTNKLVNMCDDTICFSKMTFPHQLIRLFLLEQIFRAFKIQANETYHK